MATGLTACRCKLALQRAAGLGRVLPAVGRRVARCMIARACWTSCRRMYYRSRSRRRGCVVEGHWKRRSTTTDALFRHASDSHRPRCQVQSFHRPDNLESYTHNDRACLVAVCWTHDTMTAVFNVLCNLNWLCMVDSLAWRKTIRVEIHLENFRSRNGCLRENYKVDLNEGAASPCVCGKRGR